MRFTIGFSPCPNDTFIFDEMIHNPPYGIEWDVHLEDVETLNQWSMEGKLDITKLSFATYLLVRDQYELLHAGAALGLGVGPILISREPISAASFSDIEKFVAQARIAIPGRNTTANLLLNTAFPFQKDITEIIFHEIEKKVLQGEFDAGLLIHENRFTFREKGLHQLIDLGNWWEEHKKSAIPLGGIAIRKELVPQWKEKIEHLIRESLQKSWNQYPELSGFVKDNAQEMEEQVMRSHIELYVNDETMALSPQGLQAIEILAQARH